MSVGASTRGGNPLLLGADWLASARGVPLSVRAVFGYYADTGIFDYRALKLKSYVDDTIDGIVDSAYASIERELAEEFDVAEVEFDYETKLTLPAELTLGYLYRRVLDESPADFDPITRKAKRAPLGLSWVPFDSERSRRRDERLTERYGELVERVEGIERVTELVVEALIDGDMRDALNDEEYADFVVSFDVGSRDQARQLAEVAQRTLQRSIDVHLSAFPDAVADAYRTAVEVSEGHQEEDERFRELLRRGGRAEAILEEYKYEEFETPPSIFSREVVALPYFKTQYDRVGVIYDGMIDMYRGAGFEINDDFKRSIVLAIIGAQIWLDDVSDYYDDREQEQLTPVTAEYVLAEDDADAYGSVVSIAETYLDYAKRYATDSGTPMAGIAVEYIYRKGEPSHLPR